jgi:restriction system protein
MTRYFRVSAGKNAAFLSDALSGGYVGTNWMPGVDLTGEFPDDWRKFNKRFIPVVKETDHIETNIAAGLACGMTWTLGYDVSEGDVIFVPTGESSYRIARVTGPYTFTPHTDLPHRRPVEWMPDTIERSSLGEALRRSLGSNGTVVNLDDYADEIAARIAQRPLTPTIDPVTDDDVSFALERHLEDFLVSNWAKTELGRNYDIYTDEHGEMVGRQYLTDTGPLDILASSKDGSEMLVVELKRGRLDDVVVGQVLRYMGYVSELEPTKTVRGVVIGLEDSLRLKRALQQVPNVTYMRYEVKFRLVEG